MCAGECLKAGHKAKKVSLRTGKMSDEIRGPHLSLGIVQREGEVFSVARIKCSVSWVHDGKEDMEPGREGTVAVTGSWLITLLPHSGSRERARSA